MVTRMTPVARTATYQPVEPWSTLVGLLILWVRVLPVGRIRASAVSDFLAGVGTAFRLIDNLMVHLMGLFFR
jgi:hypothetical protein